MYILHAYITCIYFLRKVQEVEFLIPYTPNSYTKANNKYLKPYEPKQESKHITYLLMKCLNFFQQIHPNG